MITCGNQATVHFHCSRRNIIPAHFSGALMSAVIVLLASGIPAVAQEPELGVEPNQTESVKRPRHGVGKKSALAERGRSGANAPAIRPWLSRFSTTSAAVSPEPALTASLSGPSSRQRNSVLSRMASGAQASSARYRISWPRWSAGVRSARTIGTDSERPHVKPSLALNQSVARSYPTRRACSRPPVERAVDRRDCLLRAKRHPARVADLAQPADLSEPYGPGAEARIGAQT